MPPQGTPSTTAAAPTEVAIEIAEVAKPASANLADSSSTTSAAASHETVDITYTDLTYDVPTPKNKEAPTKRILHGITGVAKHGEVTAIMGASGSGKSTLLDVLAGRKDSRRVGGSVLVNGRPIAAPEFHLMSAYVVQEDMYTGTLTVRENIRFSADLRLPQTLSDEEKSERVDAVVRDLGLNKVGDSLVGTEMIRGISGGEKRRLNIAMELITRPSCIFLDEPTTGLDASTANTVVKILKRLAQRGHAVVLSIHQPRFSIFREFDSLVLLSDGRLVYQGAAQAAVPYFANHSYICEAFNNPADFFLDVINGDIVPTSASSAAAEAKGRDRDTSLAAEDEDEDDNSGGKSPLIALYEASSIKDEIAATVAAIASRAAESDATADTTANRSFETPLSTQLAVVGRRTLVNCWRNPATSILQVATSIMFSLLTGLIYLNLDDDVRGLQNRIGAIFFIVMNLVFGNLSAIEIFLNERPLFIHEKANGYYRTESYFFSKVLCDIIPLRVLPTSVFATIVYFMMGFQADAGRFFFFVLGMISVSVCSASLCFAVSSKVSVFAVANLCVALSYVFFMVFAGVLMNLDSIPVYFRWLEYLSIFKYGQQALLVNELEGLEFTCDGGDESEAGAGSTACPVMGDSYLDYLGMDDNNKWTNIIALAVMSVGYLGFALHNLRKLQKE